MSNITDKKLRIMHPRIFHRKEYVWRKVKIKIKGLAQVVEYNII